MYTGCFITFSFMSAYLKVYWHSTLAKQFTEPLCIPLYGNISLRGNSDCILSLSSEWMKIFKLNLRALIQVSIKAFDTTTFEIWNICSSTSCTNSFLNYLQVSWHDMNVKLTLRKFFGKRSWSMILSTWSCDIFQRCILICKPVKHPPFAKFVSSKGQSYGLFKSWYFY